MKKLTKNSNDNIYRDKNMFVLKNTSQILLLHCLESIFTSFWLFLINTSTFRLFCDILLLPYSWAAHTDQKEDFWRFTSEY